jgi:hypothetical protein
MQTETGSVHAVVMLQHKDYYAVGILKCMLFTFPKASLQQASHLLKHKGNTSMWPLSFILDSIKKCHNLTVTQFQYNNLA